MILRLGATAAAFAAGGFLAGVTTSLAAYSVLRQIGGGKGHGIGDLPADQMPPSPYTPPAASDRSEASGPYSSGAMSGMS